MKPMKPVFAFACAAVLAACSSKPNIEIDEALAAITEETLQATTAYLADDDRQGRRAGSPGHEDAAKYVAEHFEQMGLQPGVVGGWLQTVPLVFATVEGEKSGVILHKKTGDVALEWIEEAVVYSDAIRDSSRVRAEVVFVGYGIHAPELGYSDYEGIDVEGKIVATFWGGPESIAPEELRFHTSNEAKGAELARRGAVGQILLWDRKEGESRSWDEYYAGFPKQPLRSWENESGEASQYFPKRQVLADISQSSAESLFENAPISFEDALDAAAESRPMPTALGVEATLYQETKHTRFTSPNVVGILPGSDPRLENEYVVFSAHLDHVGTDETEGEDSVYNGFYDNAVGIAVMMDTARALSSLTVAPRRSVLFLASTGEEFQKLGSEFFVNNPVVPVASIVANVNTDLPLLLFPMNTITTWGAERTTFERSAAAEVALEGFEARPFPYPDEMSEIPRSDHYSFVKKGIPFVWMMEGVGSSNANVDGLARINAFYEDHYHQVSDDLSQPIDWDSARRFARASARITYRLAMEDDAPAWNKGDVLGEQFGGK